MIGFLKGTVAHRDDPFLIVSVGGVGYKVLPATSVLAKLNGEHPRVTLFTHTHVREEALELYGFETYEDLKLFELLIGVSGIGPRTAMNVFSVGKREEITEAIAKGDVSFFTAVPRLGRKNAQKLIIELREKLGRVSELDLSESDLKENEDVILALRSFGFSAKEASQAVRATRAEGKTTEERVRLSLRYLGK